MEQYITAERIANAIMQDIRYTGYYLLVEGFKDSKFFQKYVNENNFRIREAFGKVNVKEAISILSRHGLDRKSVV